MSGAPHEGQADFNLFASCRERRQDGKIEDEGYGGFLVTFECRGIETQGLGKGMMVGAAEEIGACPSLQRVAWYRLPESGLEIALDGKKSEGVDDLRLQTQ